MGIRRIVALPVLAAVMFAAGAGACGTGEATVAGVPVIVVEHGKTRSAHPARAAERSSRAKGGTACHSLRFRGHWHLAAA